MERDEERRDAERQEESGSREAPSGSPISSGPWSGSAAGGRPREPGGFVRTAGIFAGVLVFALAFFMAGFAAHALLDEDGEGGTAAVAQPSPAPGTPSALPTVTPPPVWQRALTMTPSWGRTTRQ